MSTSALRLAFCAIAFTAGLSSQEREAPTISMDVKRIVLYATVREGKANFVGDLQKENFVVKEDGVQQQVISFSRDDVPVAVGLLVDNSRSMLNKRDQVVAAAKAFVHASNTGDEMFVLHFNEELKFGLPPEVTFTGNQSMLDAALDTMFLDGRTKLYDGIAKGLSRLRESKLSKKALIVISDGGDNESTAKAEDVIKQADLSGALFYAIGIYDPMDGDANPGVLRKLAKNTGGEAYFPDSVQEVRALCETIARDLRSQYMLSYAPTNVPDKDYHRIEVKINDPKKRKLVVRTRTGYFREGASPSSGDKKR